MKEFSDSRADKAFLEVAKAIADLRSAKTEYTNEEIAYALLQTCARVDDGQVWWSFLHEALNECINHEVRVCGNCAHWQRYTHNLDVGYHGAHAGTCSCDKFVYDGSHQPPEDGLRYWDYEGYAAGFETGERFGCAHYKTDRRADIRNNLIEE